MQRDNISTVGDNINTVEGIQYSGRRILISTCLVIDNDEKISTFFVLLLSKQLKSCPLKHCKSLNVRVGRDGHGSILEMRS